MKQRVVELFGRYERAFNSALAGDGDLDEVAGLYANVFISAVPAGIFAGTNDDKLREAMKAGFERYRAIGTQRMEVKDVRVAPINPQHALAFVDWLATYDKVGEEVAIPFTNAYFVRLQDDGAKVFGWVTGDEEAELRKHGIG